MKKAAIILMGLPGSGKGTQALKLVKRFSDLVHFDTGGEIHHRLHDPTFADDPETQELRGVYEAGILLSGYKPEWVADLVNERIRFYAKQGKGIVFSGSPRTIPEAKGIVPLLLKTYGQERVLVVILSASKRTVRKRSLNRLVCDNPKCRYPTTKEHAGEQCPGCGKKLPKATEQKKEIWKVSKLETRLKEFEERTLPAIEYLLSLGLLVEVIGAERPPDEIFADVLEAVERRLDTQPH